MTDFSGFPEAALDFYEGLESDNSKAYWTDHKALYESSVQAPMRALLAGLEPEFGPVKFFRPYRDVRFSKDKTPYKTHAAAAAQDEGQALYLQIGADGLMLAGGLWRATTDQARRLRAAIADERTGAALATVISRLTSEGFRVDGDRLQRVPKEHSEAPRQELLTLKSLTAVQQHDPAPWLHTPEARDRIASAWRELAALNSWLHQHVGPPREPARSAPGG
ncbi:MAG: hypothetical protein JWN88_2149 [Frankiales bacterium]|jgi:uncharacterized protein (TIGR02453 family)|nr:hypothetical protein [Frankiales bacterium]